MTKRWEKLSPWRLSKDLFLLFLLFAAVLECEATEDICEGDNLCEPDNEPILVPDDGASDAQATDLDVPDYAFATVLDNDKYAVAALGLIRSIRATRSFQGWKAICIVPRNHRLTPGALAALVGEGWTIREFEPIEWRGTSSNWKSGFSQLSFFNITGVVRRRIFAFDADMILLKNADGLCDTDDDFGFTAVIEHGQGMSFNTAVLCLTPDADILNTILELSERPALKLDRSKVVHSQYILGAILREISEGNLPGYEYLAGPHLPKSLHMGTTACTLYDAHTNMMLVHEATFLNQQGAEKPWDFTGRLSPDYAERCGEVQNRFVMVWAAMVSAAPREDSLHSDLIEALSSYTDLSIVLEKSLNSISPALKDKTASIEHYNLIRNAMPGNLRGVLTQLTSSFSHADAPVLGNWAVEDDEDDDSFFD